MNLWNDTEEKFKPIKEFEGLYEAGNLGSIKSLITNRILKPADDSRGYNMLVLYKNKKANTKKVHRLVAETFIANLENKPQVNHINGIKTDNRIKNLEWVTSKENINHAETMGLYKLKRIEDSKRLSKQTLDLYTGIVFDSLKKACESLNLNYSTQRNTICNNNNRLQYI